CGAHDGGEKEEPKTLRDFEIGLDHGSPLQVLKVQGRSSTKHALATGVRWWIHVAAYLHANRG
ncbi:MAG: hypothetical protein R3E01_36635, partial [Pirellulaceae bacterium]